MTLRNKITTLAVAILVTQGLWAQSLSDYQEKLSLFVRNDNFEFVQYSNVEIRQDSSSTAALSALIEQSTPDGEESPAEASIEGYRIGIYFDNSARARAGAESVMARCDSLLRDVPATMSYDNPYFKVSAGYCVDLQEAVMLLHRVQRYFPRAYLMRERITPRDLIASRGAELRAREPEEEGVSE